MMAGSDWTKVEIKNCPRCRGDHQSMYITAFRLPSSKWTHWALCPLTGEPVLFRLPLSTDDKGEIV
jgi:hypothetical protein